WSEAGRCADVKVRNPQTFSRHFAEQVSLSFYMGGENQGLFLKFRGTRDKLLKIGTVPPKSGLSQQKKSEPSKCSWKKTDNEWIVVREARTLKPPPNLTNMVRRARRSCLRRAGFGGLAREDVSSCKNPKIDREISLESIVFGIVELSCVRVDA
ncbi:hypothetical protein L9F63_023088, partial [Diploptera punctata]